MILDNSMNIHLHKIENIKYINFLIYFKAGLVYEPINKFGITHLLEHMLFRGLGDYDFDNLEKLFDNMGTEVYGKSGYNYMSLSFSVLSSKIDEAIKYFSLLFTKPLWTKADLIKEKEIVKHEIAIKGTKFSKRINALYDNPILNKSVLGTVSMINCISLDDVFEHYTNVINPANATLFISGDISDDCFNKLLSFLSVIRNNGVTKYEFKRNLVPYTAFKRINNFVLQYDYCEYSDLFLYFDIKKEYQNSARIIQYYLSGYTSPLSEELIDKNTFSYELTSHLDEWNDFSVMTFTISCKFYALCDVIDIFSKVLNTLMCEFNYDKYKKILSFIELDRIKTQTNPEESNYMHFHNCLCNISEDTPSYNDVCKAINAIFSENNFSIYTTYSIKRSDVVNSIQKFKNNLNFCM